MKSFTPQLKILLILVSLLPSPLLTQSLTLSTTSKTLNTFTLFSASLCNETSEDLNLNQAQLYNLFSLRGITLATHKSILMAKEKAEKFSWQRQVLLVLEISAYTFTIAESSKLIKINERAKAAVPIFGGVLRTATTLWPREEIKVEQNIPLRLNIPGGQCTNLELWGEDQRGLKLIRLE